MHPQGSTGSPGGQGALLLARVAPGQWYTREVIHSKNPMQKQAHYVLSRDKKGGYRFKLVAPNGETVMTSESYQTRRGMMNAVGKIATWAATKNIEEAKPAKKKTATK